MASHVDRPIILALSNPTALCEADPQDLILWTKGKALVATGAPFPNVVYDKVTYTIGQANNALLYPGLGLGTIVAQATQISDEMFWAAAQAVASTAKLENKGASLLPAVDELRTVSAVVAVAVVEAAVREGLAQAEIHDVVQQVEQAMWQPVYSQIEPI
jgi:malate dehydrogenase (oxaloacetate-decarboxylating)